MMKEQLQRNFSKTIIDQCKPPLSKSKYSLETYKHYSQLAPSGQIPSIGTNMFGDIINNLENDLVDYKSLKLSDIDLEFISTKAGIKEKHEFLPERQLVRFQFLELLVRIAIVKYYKSKIIKTFSKGIITCFERHFCTYFSSFDSRSWRLEKLWTEN